MSSKPLLTMLDWLVKSEQLVAPPEAASVKKAISDLQDALESGLPARQLQQASLELAIELNEEKIAEDINEFWLGTSPSFQEKLSEGRKKALLEILAENEKHI